MSSLSMKLSREIEFPHAGVCYKQFILRPAIILGTCKLPRLVRVDGWCEGAG